MLDFFFAMMAAGMNGSGEGEALQETAIADAPAAVIAPVEENAATVAETPQTSSSVSIAQGTVSMGEGVIVEGTAATPTVTPTPAPAAAAPAQAGMNMAVVPLGLVAEPQVPSGKFTTATEVKPILNATKGSWIAVREYDGKDLVYVTHLWSWRCGLAAMAISVNDEPMQNWPLPACHMKYATPNAILEEDGLPYLSMRLGAVEKVTIQVVYDDLSMDVAEFARGNVLIP